MHNERLEKIRKWAKPSSDLVVTKLTIDELKTMVAELLKEYDSLKYEHEMFKRELKKVIQEYYD